MNNEIIYAKQWSRGYPSKNVDEKNDSRQLVNACFPVMCYGVSQTAWIQNSLNQKYLREGFPISPQLSFRSVEWPMILIGLLRTLQSV